jgi:RNA-dependent RNA polymerase
VFLAGPEPDISNRVLRWYPQNEENFVRVTLADEDKMPYRFAYEVDNSQEIYNKVVKQLLLGEHIAKVSATPCLNCLNVPDGLCIGGRRFQFLGYSMSSLRVHTFWFMNPFKKNDGTVVDPDVVLRRVGNFSHPLRGKTPVDHYPALYPARAAQAFSATEASILVRRSEIWEEEEDVIHNTYNFTDGVGRISPELAKDVWDALMSARRCKQPGALPSAFQIRLCGFKGVLVVDYRLGGREVHFRKSQKKFDVYEWDDPHRSWPLEIAMPFGRPSQMHLNRCVIF